LRRTTPAKVTLAHGITRNFESYAAERKTQTRPLGRDARRGAESGAMLFFIENPVARRGQNAFRPRIDPVPLLTCPKTFPRRTFTLVQTYDTRDGP